MSPKGEKPHLNLIMLGHVDAGKSTTMAHVLRLTGAMSEREAREWEPVAADYEPKKMKPRH